MDELHELRFLLDGAGEALTFPEELLPHEGARRLLEFLGVKIVKTNDEIDAGIKARFGEPDLTVRCQPCEWSFTGPTTTAISEQRTHSESAAHGRKLLELVDRGESIRLPKVRGTTMNECRVCQEEPAPPRGMYAGIGAACRAKGYVNKGGQIVATTGGATVPAFPPQPEPEAPAPEPESEAPIDVPVERKVSVEEVTERIVEAAKAVFDQRRVVAAEEQRLEEAIAEYRAATSEVVPELPA